MSPVAALYRFDGDGEGIESFVIPRREGVGRSEYVPHLRCSAE